MPPCALRRAATCAFRWLRLICRLPIRYACCLIDIAAALSRLMLPTFPGMLYWRCCLLLFAIFRAAAMLDAA